MKQCSYLAMTILVAFSIKSIVFNSSYFGEIASMSALLGLCQFLLSRESEKANNAVIDKLRASEKAMNDRIEDMQAKVASMQIATGFTRKR